MEAWENPLELCVLRVRSLSRRQGKLTKIHTVMAYENVVSRPCLVSVAVFCEDTFEDWNMCKTTITPEWGKKKPLKIKQQEPPSCCSFWVFRWIRKDNCYLSLKYKPLGYCKEYVSVFDWFITIFPNKKISIEICSSWIVFVAKILFPESILDVACSPMTWDYDWSLYQRKWISVPVLKDGYLDKGQHQTVQRNF